MNKQAMWGLAAAVVMALSVTACGDDEATVAEDDTSTSTASEVDGKETEPAGEDEPGAPVEVTAVDYEFQGLPETATPGTTLSIVNESETELHELVAFRLPDVEERPVEDLLALPEGEFDPGMPVMALLAPPGGEQIAAIGDGTLLKPGRYVLICAIPTGADPAAYLEAQESQAGPPQVPGGPPHFTIGMFAELTVE